MADKNGLRDEDRWFACGLTPQAACSGCRHAALHTASPGCASIPCPAGPQVPPTMRFALDGEMPPWLLAKDLILHIIGEISVAGERRCGSGQMLVLPPPWMVAWQSRVLPVSMCLWRARYNLIAHHPPHLFTRTHLPLLTHPPRCHVPCHGVCGRRRQGHEHGGAHDHLQHGGGGRR